MSCDLDLDPNSFQIKRLVEREVGNKLYLMLL